MRWFLFKNRHLPPEDLALIFTMLVDIFQRYMTLCSDALARVQKSANNETEWPEIDESGVTLDPREEEEPGDEEMLEGDMFATEEEAFANAKERFARELPTMLAAERERLAAGGRRRTRLTFISFKEESTCQESDSAPEESDSPGAPAEPDGDERPTAGEEPMGTMGVLQTCEACSFIQFRPKNRSDTTCPYCVIVRGFVPQSDVGPTIRQIHAVFLMLKVTLDKWEANILRICQEAEHQQCSPVNVLMERVFPHWRKEYLVQARTQILPEGTDATKYARHGWDIWKGLGAEVNFTDGDAWRVLFIDLLKVMKADATAREEARAAEAARQAAREEAERIATEQAEAEARAATQRAEEAARAEAEAQEAAAREEAARLAESQIPEPEPESIPEPTPTPAPEPIPEPEPVAEPEQQAHPLDTIPLPARRESTSGEGGVWLANQISRQYPGLTTDQRKWLLAVRVERKKVIAREDPRRNPRDVGSQFNREIAYWVRRIVAANGHT
ncbi:hypothetical protein HY624_02180 [Candidatus Uhrbacteria bacterium]|nr:hypothetical protein [Candidatus Uhrbacteria bacterium]